MGSKFTFRNRSRRFTFRNLQQDNTGGGDELPDRLKQYDQWLVTKEKRPATPAEGWQKSANLLSFKEATAKADQVDGDLAFCFVDDDPFIGFDVDDVGGDGEWTDEAEHIVQQLASYTEVSSSGHGLHIIAEGHHLDTQAHRGSLTETGGIEVYDTHRYFVLTGTVFKGYDSVESRIQRVAEVQNRYLPEDSSNTAISTKQDSSPQNLAATPQQVRRTIQVYNSSSDHQVDEEVLRLWNGSDEGHSSPSEADLALVKQLYFWCKGDTALMDACFRASDRMRPKWDEQRGDQTYGEITIETAVQSNSEVFSGTYTN